MQKWRNGWRLLFTSLKMTKVVNIPCFHHQRWHFFPEFFSLWNLVYMTLILHFAPIKNIIKLSVFVIGTNWTFLGCSDSWLPTNSIFCHIHSHLKMFSDSLSLVTPLGDLSHSYWNLYTFRITETYSAVIFWFLTSSETSLEAPWVSPGQPAGKMEAFATHIGDMSR